MLYAILSEDVNDSLEKRKSARPTHLKRLDGLQNEGRLVLAGPHPAIDSNTPGEVGFSGSLVIAEFTDLQEAKNWADNDPYVTAGVYKHVVVKPFKQIYPK
ncbi:MAG: YciI family protein [Methylococcaceae bacterium]|nr:YciI family protein [Methylococcaceae bacterium]